MINHVTIRQAAERLGVSTKTVRNRIARKELPAFWEDKGEGMSSWQIPLSALEIAATSPIAEEPTLPPRPDQNHLPTPLEAITEVATTIQLKQVFRDAIKEEVAPIQNELAQLRSELDSQFKRQDERIRAAMQPPPPAKKTLWARLFG